jgi:uncharacterized membrane protein
MSFPCKAGESSSFRTQYANIAKLQVLVLIYFFGPPIKNFIDKYFNALCIIFMVLLIGGFVLLKYVF